jgi:hypothetical protein
MWKFTKQVGQEQSDLKNYQVSQQTRLILLTMKPCYCVSLVMMTAIALFCSPAEVSIELIHKFDLDRIVY